MKVLINVTILTPIPSNRQLLSLVRLEAPSDGYFRFHNHYSSLVFVLGFKRFIQTHSLAFEVGPFVDICTPRMSHSVTIMTAIQYHLRVMSCIIWYHSTSSMMVVSVYYLLSIITQVIRSSEICIKICLHEFTNISARGPRSVAWKELTNSSAVLGAFDRLG